MKRLSNHSWGFVFLLVAAGIALHFFKKFTLSYHTRDYQYYLNTFEFRWNLLTEESHKVLLHPKGKNVLGFSGTDGYPTIQTDIHFSPITYPLSLLNQLGGEIILVFIFSLSVAITLIYLINICLENDVDIKVKRIFLYASLSVGAIQLITYDLRIWVLLVPCVLLLFLSIRNNSSALTIILLSFLALSIREESYYFVLICAAYLTYFGRQRLAFCLAIFSFVQLALAYYYFIQKTGLSFSIGKVTLIFLMTPVAVFMLSQQTMFHKFIGARWFRKKVYKVFSFNELSEETKSLYIWLLLLLFPLVANIIITRDFPGFFVGERYFFLLAFSCVVGIRLLNFRITWHKYTSLLVFFTITMLALTSLSRMISRTDISLAEEVWRISKKTSFQTNFITSYKLQQAFWKHHGVVFQRLPAVSKNDLDRFWPKNRERLIEVIRKSSFAIFHINDAAPLELFKNEGFNCVMSNSLILCTRATKRAKP
jgi:hypothetical protein